MFCFEKGFLCVALAVLELTLQNRLAWKDSPASASPSAGIKGVQHLPDASLVFKPNGIKPLTTCVWLCNFIISCVTAVISSHAVCENWITPYTVLNTQVSTPIAHMKQEQTWWHSIIHQHLWRWERRATLWILGQLGLQVRPCFRGWSLRALTALPEDSDSTPSTHMAVQNCL